MKTSILKSIAAILPAAILAVACTTSTLPTAATPSTDDTSAVVATMTAATATAGAGTCATGDGVNDACACDADARKYCSGFYGADWQSYATANGYTTASWKLGLLDCLGTQDVSTACQTSCDRREALNAQMMSACASYCRGTTPKPGSEPCVDHLKEIYATLDTACRSALDAHEAAKAMNQRSPF